jgi:hypothetical protein
MINNWTEMSVHKYEKISKYLEDDYIEPEFEIQVDSEGNKAIIQSYGIYEDLTSVNCFGVDCIWDMIEEFN